MTPPFVAVRGLAKTYRLGGHDVPVLRGVELDAERGSFTAITGRSGSGKSSLLHILGGLDRGDGSYRLDGREMSDLDDDARSRLRASRIGFVFQSFHLLPQLTVAENVGLPCLYAPRRGETAARVAAALDRVNLSHRRGHRPRELSGGEMQRAAIARAIVMEPDLLLADEPTGNLDRDSAGIVMETLGRLNATGTTVVLVTHDAEVARHASRRLLLAEGRLHG